MSLQQWADAVWDARERVAVFYGREGKPSKLRERALDAIGGLHWDLTQGFWSPGRSRGVKAALAKHDAAQKIAEDLFDGDFGRSTEAKLMFAMIFC